MRRYTVQWAYALDIGTPVVHRNEEMARGEVAHLLGTWIRRRLGDWIERTDSSPIFKRYPELEKSVRYLVPTIGRLMQEGLVWDAYDLWEEFYVTFENVLEYPLYVMLGTVIVQGSKETGLKNRVPLIEPMDGPPADYYIKTPTVVINKTQELKDQMIAELLEVIFRKAGLKDIELTREQIEDAIDSTDRRLQGKYPYMDEESEAKYIAELREGILRKLFPKLSGPGLGALQRWMVQYADFGGTWHPARHTNEEMAKDETALHLRTLLHHLGVQADHNSHMERNQEFVAEATELIHHVIYLLDNNMVWAAYLDYKAFEDKWDHHFAPFTLTMSIGSMRVSPEPESE